MHSHRSLFDELTRHPSAGMDTRAETAYNVAVKFIDLLRSQITDDKAFDLMMKAWFRAVKDGDFSKFLRTYKKYQEEP